uniref:Capsid polyprotein VP90 n=1 Tax=Mamastrovirus 2 TaxID=1239566 RepID=A0A5J6KK48_9VIRU|nr:capsid protein [Mamastrovirus 2]QEV86986.1 ORF2 [Mamastrovirus 2]
MASKSGKEVTVEVNNTNGRSRSKSRPRSRSRGRSKAVKITVNSRGSSKGRQSGRSKRQSSQRVRNIVNKQLRKQGVTGPKPAVCQKATATLGTVGSNTSGTTEIEACILLNPVLVKDATGSTQFGPVQALGAQYSMWKLKYLNVKLTSMVGASAVNGTVVRVSLNPTSTPSSTSWSGLGARKHLDVTVGKNAVFKLRPADLGGPRDGWWLTNTNDNASDTLGPSIEIHTLGQTMSSYKNEQFTGGLFLVELASEWCFTGYAANPNLVNLEKSTDKNVAVTFEGSAGAPLVMNVPETSHFARTAVARSAQPTTLARAGERTTSDTVWQVLNTAVSAAELVTPPPFNWLVKGGWWFVKLISGRTRTGQNSFYVYPSYQDALSNKPAICTGGLPSSARLRTATPTTLQFTQMNQPSLGHGATPTIFGVAIPEPDTIWRLVFDPTNVGPTRPNHGIHLTGNYTSDTLRIGPSISGNNFSLVHMIVRVENPKLFNRKWEPLPTPDPIPNLRLYGGTTHIGDVLLKSQVQGPSGASTPFTATAYVVVMRASATPRTSNGWNTTKAAQYSYMQVAQTTDAAEWRLLQGVWYLMLSFGNGANNTWYWSHSAITSSTKIYPTVFSQFLNPVPRPYTTMVELDDIAIPALHDGDGGGADELDAGDLVHEIELSRSYAGWVEGEHCDTIDTAEPPPFEREDVSGEETDIETESDEDEDDEVDRFDLHDSSGSEPEDDDVENDRITLLNTLINQGIEITRAAKISKRAYPTLAEKVRRGVYMDLLTTGVTPSAAWAEACKQARKASRRVNQNSLPASTSESRGHAE